MQAEVYFKSNIFIAKRSLSPIAFTTSENRRWAKHCLPDLRYQSQAVGSFSNQLPPFAQQTQRVTSAPSTRMPRLEVTEQENEYGISSLKTRTGQGREEMIF